MSAREDYRKAGQNARIALEAQVVDIPCALTDRRKIDRAIGSLLGYRVICVQLAKGDRLWREFRQLRGPRWAVQYPRPQYHRSPARRTRAEAYDDFPRFSSTSDKYLLWDMLGLLEMLTGGDIDSVALLGTPDPAYQICLEIIRRICNG